MHEQNSKAISKIGNNSKYCSIKSNQIQDEDKVQFAGTRSSDDQNNYGGKNSSSSKRGRGAESNQSEIETTEEEQEKNSKKFHCSNNMIASSYEGNNSLLSAPTLVPTPILLLCNSVPVVVVGGESGQRRAEEEEEMEKNDKKVPSDGLQKKDLSSGSISLERTQSTGNRNLSTKRVDQKKKCTIATAVPPEVADDDVAMSEGDKSKDVINGRSTRRRESKVMRCSNKADAELKDAVRARNLKNWSMGKKFYKFSKEKKAAKTLGENIPSTLPPLVTYSQSSHF